MNDRLLPEVIRAKKLGRVTDELVRMWLEMIQKALRKPHYQQLTYQGDMEQEALKDLCANGLKFDENKSQNPFAYYYSCMTCSFLQVTHRERKEMKIKEEYPLYMDDDNAHTT